MIRDISLSVSALTCIAFFVIVHFILILIPNIKIKNESNPKKGNKFSGVSDIVRQIISKNHSFLSYWTDYFKLAKEYKEEGILLKESLSHLKYVINFHIMKIKSHIIIL